MPYKTESERRTGTPRPWSTWGYRITTDLAAHSIGNNERWLFHPQHALWWERRWGSCPNFDILGVLVDLQGIRTHHTKSEFLHNTRHSTLIKVFIQWKIHHRMQASVYLLLSQHDWKLNIKLYRHPYRVMWQRKSCVQRLQIGNPCSRRASFNWRALTGSTSLPDGHQFWEPPKQM